MLTGKIHLDGSISIGRVPPKKMRGEDAKYDALREMPECKVEEQSDLFGGRRIKLKYSDPDLNQRGINDFRLRLDPPTKLCQVETEKAKRPSRYGLKGITNKGKQSIKNGGAYLERKYGKGRLGLLTLTLPSEKQGFTEETLEKIATHWGDIQRRFGKELERELARVNAPPEFCLVSEIQEKRFSSEGLPVPHLHLCYVSCQNPRKPKWYIPADRFREIWGRIISSYLPPDTDHWQGGVDCQRIKKSASGYLAKYMSKGAKVVNKIREEGLEQWLPRQWWSLWGKLKAKIKALTYNLCSAECESIFYAKDETLNNELITWKRLYVEIDPGWELCVGLWGRLSCMQYEWWTCMPWSLA